MRILIRTACAILSLVLFAGLACADGSLIPLADGWLADGEPIRALISVQLDELAPNGELRMEQLNALLSHLSLELVAYRSRDLTSGSTRVLVDGEEIIGWDQAENETGSGVILTALPDQTFTSRTGNAVELLLGDGPEMAIGSIDEAALSLPEELYALLQQLPEALPEYHAEKKVQSAVPKMGTAVHKDTVTVPADQAEEFGTALKKVCTSGRLGAIIAPLVFSGKQSVMTLQNENGDIIKATYSGRCGTDEEHLRSVTMTWLLRREEENTLDKFTLKAPAVKGTDRDSVTFERTAAVKKGELVCEAEVKHEAVLDKKKTTTRMSVNLKPVDGKSLTGTVTLKLTPPGDDAETVTLTVKPDLQADQDTDAVTGTAVFEYKQAKRVLAAGNAKLTLSPAGSIPSVPMETGTDLSTLSAAELGQWQQKAAAAATTALIRRLVLLPDEDTAWLSADLDPAVWKRIQDEARKVPLTLP